MSSRTPDPHDFLDLDAGLAEEERAIRDAVRAYAKDHLLDHVADWYETGVLPAAELAKGFGSLGLLGMHLEGYGCAGTSAVARSISCARVAVSAITVRLILRAPPTAYLRAREELEFARFATLARSRDYFQRETIFPPGFSEQSLGEKVVPPRERA